MLKEYDVVLLKQSIPEVPLPSGTRGAILMVYHDNPPAYEVEFVDDFGNSLGVHTVREVDLSLICDGG